MRVKGFIQGAAAALPLFMVGAVLAAGHDNCSFCHATDTPSASNLLQPPSALCSGCHPARIAAGEHVVEVPVVAPSNTLPLQAGLMTCVTCHDPHATGTALRLPPPQLCRSCHPR